MVENIGFVSTRLAGTDGVSLESSKWADVFENNGYRCFWFAGEVDRESEKSFLEEDRFIGRKYSTNGNNFQINLPNILMHPV